MYDLGYTNVALLEIFDEELNLYEENIKPNSNHFPDYVHPASIMGGALLRIATASQADTYSLMRRLAARINSKIDDEYSDYAIRMMAAATKDIRANELIMAILYITRDVLLGDSIELSDRWLVLVNYNMTIFQFLKNYQHSDQQQLERTYSGNVISSATTIEKLSFSESQVSLLIGYANYEVKLVGETMQTVAFGCSPLIKRSETAKPNEELTIASEVILTPTIGVLAIDKSVTFYDDAKAQVHAQGSRYIHGYDTQITLPGLFYSVALNIISSNSGKTWRVSEINILPPSLDRDLT